MYSTGSQKQCAQYAHCRRRMLPIAEHEMVPSRKRMPQQQQLKYYITSNTIKKELKKPKIAL